MWVITLPPFDKDTTGLLLATSDGQLCAALTRPGACGKRYVVTTDRTPAPAQLEVRAAPTAHCSA